MSNQQRYFLYCLLLLILTHFLQLGNLPFSGADEPRYARIGEEMLLSGDYVTPTLNHLPWLEKPPLLFWMEAASFRMFGVAEWSARLPVALLSALSALFCAFFAYHQMNGRAAFLTFAILVTTPLYFVYARAASTDAPLTACFSLAMVGAYLSFKSRRIGWLVLAGFFLGLAVLAKGPVAILLFSAIWLLYALIRGIWPWDWKHCLSAVIVLLITVAPWFWLVWVANGYDFIATFLVNHHLARYFTEVHRHSQPFWFFFAVIIGGFFPWSFFLPTSLTRLWRWGRKAPRSEADLVVFLWLWVLIPVAFFSLSDSKLAGYVLPVFPALALLAAVEWDRFLALDVRLIRPIKKEVTALLAFTVVITVALVIGVALYFQAVGLGVLLAAPVALGVAWGWRELRRNRPAGLFLSLSGGMALFGALAYAVAAPTVGDFFSAKDLTLEVRPSLSRDEPLILYRFFHHTALYYSDYNATPEAVPGLEVLWSHFEAHPQDRYFLLTKAGGLKDLQRSLNLVKVDRKGNFYMVESLPPSGPVPDE